MLQSIHDKTKGILGIVIVVLIGATFALWGIGDYLSGAKEKAAARVDGVEISQSEFEQGLTMQRQRLEQMFQGELPDSPLFQEQIKKQVLDQLITQRVLQKVTGEQGYRVPDQVLAERIRNIEAFQQDGVFAKDVYQAVVTSQGRGIKEFENLYRNDLAIQQLQDAVMRSSIVGQKELNILNQLQQQGRDINYLQFDSSVYLQNIDVSESEITDYYDRNNARYMNPETVSISYVELKGSEMDADIPVDEEAVRRLYDEYVASLASREQRKASHILVAVPADADEATLNEKQGKLQGLLDRINKGESFAAVAKEASEDPGSASSGGDLGWVSKGMMVPEFESALFKLKKGEISGVVKSSFGLHIIKLDEIKQEDVVSLEQKRPELEAQYKAQLVEDRFYEKSELMATTAYENDQSLQAVADAIGQPIKTAGPFSRAMGQGVAANEKVRKAAFTSEVLSEGRNSDIIEMGKNHALVLRIDKRTEASLKPLDEVKAQISAVLRAEKAQQKAMAAALESLARLQAGDSMESQQAKLVKVGKITREDSSVNPQIIETAFTMPKPGDKPAYQVVELATGAAVIELKSVTRPPEASMQQMVELGTQFNNELARRDMEAVINYLKSESDIVIPESK